MTTVVALVGLALLWSGPKVDGHIHKAPHGGVIVHVAGLRHLELVVADGMMRVWVLDERERVMPPKAGSTVTVNTDFGATSAPNLLRLELVGDHYEVRFRTDHGFTARVAATVAGRQVEAVLRWTMLDARDRLNDMTETKF